MTEVRAARRPRKWRRHLLAAVRTSVALLSLAALVGSGYAWVAYRDFKSSVVTAAPLPEPTQGAKPDVDGTDQNILLIGNDSRAGATPEELQQLSTQDDGGSANTDTMIILHVPADGSSATLISFPRDSYVSIPGYGEDRLNAAYPDGYFSAKSAGKSELEAQSAGIALTAQTLTTLTGLTIDHYVQVNLLGFYRISEAIGGVDVCLNQAMRPATKYGQKGDGFDSGFEPNGQFVYSYSGIDLPAGVSKNISGKQALAFVRQRHGLPDSDLDRVARQRYFLGAVFRKAASAGVLLNPFKLRSLLSAVGSSLVTDPNLDFLKLAAQLQDLQAGNIRGATMVTVGPATLDGKDVLKVDPAAVQAQMQQLVTTRTDSTYATAEAAAPSQVAVQVLNGSQTDGAAASAATALSGMGFNVSGQGNAPTITSTTTILYPQGKQSEAKALAAVVPGAAVALSTTVTELTLTLGNDGLGVAAATPTTGGSPIPTTAAQAGGAAPAVETSQGGLACIN